MVDREPNLNKWGHYCEKMPIAIGSVDSGQAQIDDQIVRKIMEPSVVNFLGQLVSQLAAYREERRALEQERQTPVVQKPYRPLAAKIRQIMHSFPIF